MMKTEYINLIGSEDVQKAAQEIDNAAETMRQAALNMQAAFHPHHVWMDEWLLRLETALRGDSEK